MGMFDAGPPPAFPRMSPDEAAERVIQLSGRPVQQLVQDSSSSVDGATYYETAPARVTQRDLDLVQRKVRALAMAHGYPERQPRGGSLEFDQQLTVLLNESLNILPADAADEGVWSFFTLNVCPDVALWRFPNDANPEGDIRERYERLIGKPRNVFRRAWWRGYVLGSDLSSSLLEDESVQIMERPSIGGNARFAREVASAHLDRVRSGRVRQRQDLLREAIKIIRRRMGQISVYSLTDGQLRELIVHAFDEASKAFARTIRIDEVQSPLEKFRAGIADLWHLVDGYAQEVDWVDISELQDQLSEYRDEIFTNYALAAKIADDLDALISGWQEYTPEERIVVYCATSYFLLAQDDVPDDSPNGLDDDDLVVSAAYTALSRVRD